MTCRAAPDCAVEVGDLGDRFDVDVTASLPGSVLHAAQKYRKASILLALRAVCCKIAVGGQQALLPARACAADSHYSRKGV